MGKGKKQKMTTQMTIRCNKAAGLFSINKIAEAIRKAAEPLSLHEAAEFGGESSIAFRERLVREYNAEHVTHCPACGNALVSTGNGEADCRHCKKTYSFPNEGARLCYVNEEDVAEFVGRRIGNGFANHTGDHYHLGEVRGRTLYYGTAPAKRFFSSHKGDDVAIVLGSNSAEVPEDWHGHVAYFSELFYVNEACGDIRISGNILRGLLPKPPKSKLATGERKVHKRRGEWLMFCAHLLSKPYNDSDFYRGTIRPQVVCEWFRKKVNGAPKNAKEYQRDLHAFRHLDKGTSKPDQREQFIILLLRTAADKRRTEKERLGIAKLIPELVLYLQKGAEKNHGRPIEITRGAWQHCKDGTKEYVAVTDIERYFDDLDERLSRSA